MKILNIILIGIVVAALFGVGFFFYLGVKSKSGAPPGLVNGELAACPSSPNCVVSESHADGKHRIAPLPLSAWAKIPKAVDGLGGKITHTAENYIATTFTSKTFGFVDDVEFRKGEDEVHVRSASRVGYSDAGVNRTRVETLRAALLE